MAITLTPHGQRPREADSALIDAPGAQTGDVITVADDAVSAELPAGLYRVKATSANTVRFQEGGAAPSDATNGEPWAADEKEWRYFAADFFCAVDAVA